ncbi:MAG: hypothetical protein AAF984_03990 [Verrucomicrobiota bacterium]
MTSANTWPKWLSWLLASLVLFQIIVLCTAPIKDGDIFFHMVYGQTALEEKTLIADHSRYTWTPASNDNLYCNWFSQVFFYLLYSAGGFFALFAFKYVVALIFFGLLLHLAKLTGSLKNPIMWAIGIVGFSMSNHSGVVIKPEAFSFIGIMLFCYLWARIRLSSNQSSRLPYFYPVIMAIWVNSHGGFIFGATFLFLMWLGEQINIFFSPQEALPRGTRKHLFIACVLSAGALFVNPHGAEYLINIAQGLQGSSVEELRTVSDYRTAFSIEGHWMNLPSFLVIALALLALALRDPIRDKRINWAVILTNLFFTFLFCYMVRTAYFWGVVFSFMSLYLLKYTSSLPMPRAKWIRIGQIAAPVGFTLIFSLVLLYKKTYQPGGNHWFGYGMSIRNPQDEAEYIREHLSTFKLGNDYDSGAYLMWTLYPDQKHMIDQRYFPFKAWYAEYFNAMNGIGTKKFIDKMDCDIWCIGYISNKAIDWFRDSPEWELLFYGQSAVIFARHDLDLEPASPLGGKTIENIPALSWAGSLLTFAANIEDWEGALRIYHGFSGNFSGSKAATDARRFLEGSLFYRAHNFALAAERFTPLEGGSSFKDDGILSNSYLHTTADHWNKNELDTAFTYAQATVLVASKNLMAHYNYGVMAAFLEADGDSLKTVKGLPNWRKSLQIYVDHFDKVNNLPSQTLTLAHDVLGAGIKEKPQLIEPRKPDPEKIDYFKGLLEQL